MRITRRSFFAGAALLASAARAAPPAPVDAAADRFFRAQLDVYPFWASALGLATEAQRAAIDADITPAGRERIGAACRRALADLGAIDRSRLPEGDRITWDVTDFRARDALAQLDFPDHLLPVNQMFYGGLFTLASPTQNGLSNFATVEDHRLHLERLRRAPGWCDQAIVNLREGMARGIVLPRVLVERMLPMVRRLLETSPQANPLASPVKLIPPSASPRERAALERAYAEVLQRTLLPATARLMYVLEHDYLPRGRDTDGYGALPDGAAWYRQFVRSGTTTALSPEEIHAIGLSEVDRLRGELARIQAGYRFEGSLPAFFEWHSRRPEETPFRTEEDVLEAYSRLDQRIGAGLPKLFGRAPRAALQIRPEPELTRDTASDHYMPPAADGSRPGVFYAVVPDPRRYGKSDLVSLFLHEGRPGHHYQLALQQELPLPALRRFGAEIAYAEGWGLYAETLGYELGVYEDVDAEYGHLVAAMLRAVRLVVDTGLHAQGWPRERAIAYLATETGATEQFARAQVERYMAWPGQALGYAVGRLAIERLRDRSRQALGTRFSLPAFHDAVLDQGSMPLTVLDDRIARWSDAARA